MINPFKEILENEQLPEEIRKRVINDIDLINLSLQMADLFVVKTPDFLASFFDRSQLEEPLSNDESDNQNPDKNE